MSHSFSFLSRLIPDRWLKVLVTITPEETTFAVFGDRDALTLKNVVCVSAHEPYVVSSVGEDGPPPHGQVLIDLFRGGAIPIAQSKVDVLSVFFSHGLRELLGARWAAGFSVVFIGASSLAECLSGYHESVLKQAMTQHITGARKVTFERHVS